MPDSFDDRVRGAVASTDCCPEDFAIEVLTRLDGGELSPLAMASRLHMKQPRTQRMVLVGGQHRVVLRYSGMEAGGMREAQGAHPRRTPGGRSRQARAERGGGGEALCMNALMLTAT